MARRILKTRADKNALLDETEVELLDSLDITPTLLALLVKEHVIPQKQRENIQAEPKHHQGVEVVRLLRKATLEEFFGFCRALCDRDIAKKSIIEEIFNLDVNCLHVQKEQARAMLRRMVDSIQSEIVDDQPRLVGSKGIGLLVEDPRFIGYLRALRILQDGDIETITVERIRGNKASALIRYLQPCSLKQLCAFAWLLVKMERGNLLPKSITDDVAKLLRQLDENGITTIEF